jgi:DNA-binding MarR family transcriptional regulator
MSASPPTITEMERLKAFFTNSLSRNLRIVSEWSVAGFYNALHKRGHEGIRRSHELVLVPLRLKGSRVVDLAATGAVTKNAISQVANDLERLGYIERQDDPQDGRARLLRYSPLGMQLLVDAMQAGEEVEQQIAAIIGKVRAAEFVQLLADLAAGLQATQVLPPSGLHPPKPE